ncbi:MAG: hypothetical protein ACYCUI_15740 [Vulcanimicrobiaceae bacterium]
MKTKDNEELERPKDGPYKRPTDLMYGFLAAMERLLDYGFSATITSTDFASWKLLLDQKKTTRGHLPIERVFQLAPVKWEHMEGFFLDYLGFDIKNLKEEEKRELKKFQGRPLYFFDIFLEVCLKYLLCNVTGILGSTQRTKS